MQFQNKAQEEVYTRVGRFMKELFGDMVFVRDDAPIYGIRFGSAFIQVSVYPWGDADSTITTRAYVVYGAELTPELMKFLLRKNEEMRFGAFGIDGEGDIEFEHTIVGATCQKEELKASVYTVMKVADQLDDEIVAKWGGQRALDKMR
jgi:hypothetical protein